MSRASNAEAAAARLTLARTRPQASAAEEMARAYCRRGDTQAAAALVLRAHGPEIRSFMYGVLRSYHEAEEAFSYFSRTLWKSLGSFRWESSLRSWCYCVARSAIHMQLRTARRAKELPRRPSELDEVPVDRTPTVSWLRTDMRDRLAALRSTLDVDDQMLLTLRFERGLSWEEVATVLGGQIDSELTAAALRKRYQRLRARLRAQLQKASSCERQPK